MSRGRKALVFIAVLVLAMVGTFLAAGSGSDDRGVHWMKSHLDTVRAELDGLAGHLRRYKEKHGRYPSNDEGLAALDTFETRFPVPFGGGDVSDDPRKGGAWLQSLKPWHWYPRDKVKEYRAKHGRAPANLDEFLDADVYERYPLSLMRGAETVTLDVAIDSDDGIWVVGGGGVFSPWGLPYVYENRAGLPAESFEGSPAGAWGSGRFSVRVDEGVHVSSVAGELWDGEYRADWWWRNGPRFAGVALIAAAVALAFSMRRRMKNTAAAVGFGVMIGFGAHATGWSTCYVMMPLFYRRDPTAVERRRELLEKYHEKGVIGDEAYRKALSSPGIAPPKDGAAEVRREEQ